MRNRRWLWVGSGVIAAVWVALLAAVVAAHRSLNRNPPTELARPTAGMTPLWPAPPFAFTDQDGHRTTDADLAGHAYVADFIFTTCTTACPTLTAKLALVRRAVASPDVRFVSFSVDPAHDTPAALKAYAEQWGDADPRWRLLSTTPAGLAAVTKGFKVTAEASGDPDNPILHSTLFLLVDGAGQVRGAYDSTDDAQVAKLGDDLRSLAGRPAVTPVMTASGDAVERGHQAYVAMGCVACHANAKLAPPLASLHNGMVRLTDGTTVWADDAYLHESITHPAAKIVAGYLNSMPSYRSSLSEQQATDLVAYIASLSANPPGGHGVALVGRRPTTTPAAVEVDPVCHMTVAVNPATAAVTAGGRTFHFCSNTCRERFEREPTRFLSESKNTTRP